MEPESEEQVAVRHADASGGDIRENEHEEDRMRDIHVGKRGSEAAGEEQPDKLRKTVRFEQEAPNTSSASSTNVSIECLAIGLESVLVQNSVHVDNDIRVSALDMFYEMDGRESR